MSLTITDDVLSATNMSESEMAMEVAVILYRAGDLPLARAAEFARMGEAQFAHLLASREIPLKDRAAEAARR